MSALTCFELLLSFKPSRSRHLALTALLLSPLTTGCFGFEGGANMNEQAPGSGDDGVHLSLGDIAIHPDGSHLLARSGDILIRADIDNGHARELPGLPKPERLAFDPASDRVFVTSFTDKGPRLVAYDTDTGAQDWAVPTDIVSYSLPDLNYGSSMPRLAPTRDGQLLLASHEDRVEIFEPSSGSVIHELASPRAIVDVDVDNNSHTAFLTLDHEWNDETDIPETLLEIVDLDAGTKKTVSIPNCSSELMIAEQAAIGFIAPTTCQRDPVSVIDLATGEFVKNLPGFGPVALPLRSSVAVAFADTTNLDMELFGPEDPVPSEEDGRFHLMFIDVDTLAFDFIPVGDELPRFAMAPQGDLLVVDHDYGGWLGQEGGTRVRILDLHSRELINVAGPEVELDHYSWSPDGQAVWLLDDGLFELSVPKRQVIERPLAFEPTNLNMTPDGSRLILREDSSTLWVFDTETTTLEREIQVDADSVSQGG